MSRSMVKVADRAHTTADRLVRLFSKVQSHALHAAVGKVE